MMDASMDVPARMGMGHGNGDRMKEDEIHNYRQDIHHTNHFLSSISRSKYVKSSLLQSIQHNLAINTNTIHKYNTKQHLDTTQQYHAIENKMLLIVCIPMN